MAQITLEVEEQTTKGTNIMGIDLGIKVPAVCVTSNNKVKFAVAAFVDMVWQPLTLTYLL